MHLIDSTPENMSSAEAESSLAEASELLGLYFTADIT